MQDPTFEVEIKSLLGNRDNADRLLAKLRELDPNHELTEQSQQLNHYFTGGDHTQASQNVSPFLENKAKEKLQHVLENSKKTSVRTRQLNDKVLLVVKASIDDTTSENGISRVEFEEETPELSLQELDNLLLQADLEYQAKWSREREVYRLSQNLIDQLHTAHTQKNNINFPKPEAINISLDKNAGYGHLAEFEIMLDDAQHTTNTKALLRSIMEKLEAEELAQDRLERMFAHYNQNWQDYYGTDKVFIIE